MPTLEKAHFIFLNVKLYILHKSYITLINCNTRVEILTFCTLNLHGVIYSSGRQIGNRDRDRARTGADQMD